MSEIKGNKSDRQKWLEFFVSVISPIFICLLELPKRRVSDPITDACRKEAAKQQMIALGCKYGIVTPRRWLRPPPVFSSSRLIGLVAFRRSHFAKLSFFPFFHFFHLPFPHIVFSSKCHQHIEIQFQKLTNNKPIKSNPNKSI